MAGVATPPLPSSGGFASRLARAQYAALAWAQTRIFLSSLRSMRGSFELGARILSILIFCVVAFGPALGLGFGACYMALQGHLRSIGVLLWILCLVWQFFSAVAPALAGQNPELSHLLRYPVSFGSWILLYLVYGLVAPSTLIGLLWALAITVGVTVARPDLFLWTAATLAIFSIFNLLLARMILSWIERWMAQRRTREIVSAIFLFLALAGQALNPAFHQNRHGVPYGLTRTKISRVFDRFWALQSALPPALAIDVIARSMEHRNVEAIESLGWLGLYSVAAGSLLAVRLRAESRGENFSEVQRVSRAAASPQIRSRPFLDFSGPIAAVFEKDLRYLMRSGPMLYNLAAPLVMVVVFGGSLRNSGAVPSIGMEYLLPMGIVWAFLGLTRLVCNSFGGEGEGIQFYYLSPTPLRRVVLGKNALHLLVFLLEAALISVVIVVRFGPPPLSVVALTAAWILFAVPANFTVGNLLSVLMPYRMNLVRIRRERGAAGNGLLSLLSQLTILVIGALVVVPCAAFGHPWLAPPILLALAVVSITAYLRVLSRVDGMAQSRMDLLLKGAEVSSAR